MTLINLLWEIPIAILLIFAGLFFHEILHFVVGYLSGGTPFFTRSWFGIPTQVDYKTPEQMSDNQVRLAGGIVVFSPLTILLLFGITTPSQASEMLWILLFLGGASGISWTDVFATTHPKLWKRFTKGEPIGRSDIE
jgi:UDP-N-acetylmuramyl pentapeptide phosphotransferase/UDP-N-acetylglucosamine-1-phosphate transferase